MGNITDFLQKLTIDYWYKMLIPLSLSLFVLAITADLHVISNGSLVLLSIGLFMIGLGEWINHPYQEQISPDRTFKITGHPRKLKPGGVILDAVGSVVGGFGLVKIVIAAI